LSDRGEGQSPDAVPTVGPGSTLARLWRFLRAPERLYMIALSLSGVAAVVSVVLPVTQRGVLAACVVSATVGAAIGSFSIDTFFLSRPAGWVAGRGRWWVLALLTGSIVLSIVAAAALTAVEGVGAYLVSMPGAAVLTVFNACSSLALRQHRFVFVYTMRALGGVALITGYALLYAGGDLHGDQWGAVWLGAQSLAALAVGAQVLRGARRFGIGPSGQRPPRQETREYRGDLFSMGKLHVGVCAQMLTFRLDQVLLPRFAGAGPLGVYALTVAALEFSQAGAVVMSQKILANRGPRAQTATVSQTARTVLPIALLAVGALAALGVIAPGYHGAWLLGVLLLPGCLAVAMGKTWSASLLRQRGGEQATSTVALITLAVAVPAYLVGIPWAGAVGAAGASSVVYTVHAACSWLSLRRRDESRLVSGTV